MIRLNKRSRSSLEDATLDSGSVAWNLTKLKSNSASRSHNVADRVSGLVDSTRWHEGDLDGLVLLVARPPSFGLGLILLRPRVLVSSMLMSGCLGLKWVSMRSRRLVLLLLLVWIVVILRGSGTGKKS